MAAINFPASPSNGDTHQGFVYNSTLGVWQSAASQTAVTSFTGLSDTPSALGTAGQIAKVNSGGTALEFADQSGVTVYANVDALPSSGNAGDLAFVSATNRLYIWNGSGWYNIALINTNPTISGANSAYELASDGTPTVITITATDPEGLPITYSIASDTSGNTATVTQGTGANTNVFTITPSTNDADAGTFSLTFRASDGVNIASAISEFTLAFQVQNSNYTTALITSVGTNNQVNNDFVDSSTNSHTITAVGNATQTTFSPYRHGGYSTYFDGSGDYFSAGSNSAFAFGTGDFTIEGWIFRSGSAGGSNATVHIICDTRLTNGGPGVALQVNSSTGALSYYDSTEKISAGSAPSNTWTHYAVSRSGSTVRGFINGVQVGSATITTNYTDSSSLIGTNIPQNNYINGYLSDVRIVKGTAVYTSAFTPPTERLTAITNTSLLTCHLPYFADGSTNGHTITVNGNTHTRPFAPYDSQEYTAASHSGSAFFDGSGDYISAPAASIARGTDDYTIETWIYLHSLPNTIQVWDTRTAAQAIDDFLTVQTDGSLRWRNNGIHTTPAGTVPLNTWTHITQCRNSGTVKTYVNGIEKVSHTNTANLSHGAVISIGGSIVDNGAYAVGNFADFRVVLGTAVYTADFTPPTAPLTAITNTSLLVQGTNAGIIDKAQSIKDFALTGNTQSSTAQSKYLSSSLYFDGTGDYIRVTNNEGLFDLGFNGEPFTMEWWQYLPNIVDASIGPQTGGGFGGWNGSTGHQFTVFFYSGATTLFYQWWNGSSRTDYNFNHGGAFSANTWQHVATVYDGTNLSTYVDGTRVGYRTSGNTFGSVTTKYAALGSNATTTEGLGEIYYSDVRITKGLARYSGTSFTPPTAALEG